MILGYTLTTFRHNYIIHHFVGWLDFPLFNFPFPTFPFVKSLDVYSEVVVNLYPYARRYPHHFIISIKYECHILFRCKPYYIPSGLSENGVLSIPLGKKHVFSSRNGHLGQIQTSFSWSHLPFPSNSPYITIKPMIFHSYPIFFGIYVIYPCYPIWPYKWEYHGTYLSIQNPIFFPRFQVTSCCGLMDGPARRCLLKSWRRNCRLGFLTEKWASMFNSCYNGWLMDG